MTSLEFAGESDGDEVDEDSDDGDNTGTADDAALGGLTLAIASGPGDDLDEFSRDATSWGGNVWLAGFEELGVSGLRTILWLNTAGPPETIIESSELDTDELETAFGS